MSESSHGWRRILAAPWAYSLSQHTFGGFNRMRLFVDDYVKPFPGMRVLDIGCGPGEIVGMMPGVEYHGFDREPSYIERARKRFGHLGEFHCMDVMDADLDAESFDAVVSFGVLHHLDDDGVDHLLSLGAGLLGPKGRLVTGDPTWVPNVDPLNRWFLRNDRGQAIREPEEYARLAKQRFGSVTVRTERVPLPVLRARFPLAIVESQGPLREPAPTATEA